MKNPIPPQFAIGAVLVVVLVIGFFFVKGLTTTPRTPRPDPALFGYAKGKSGPPNVSQPAVR